MYKTIPLLADYYLCIGWSESDLWFSTTKDGAKLHHLFGISVMEKENLPKTIHLILYKLQLMIWKLTD